MNTNIPIASSLLIKRYDLTLFKARTFLSLLSSLFVLFHYVLAHVCFQGCFLFFTIVNFSMILMPDNYLIHLHHTFAIRVHVKFHELYQSLSTSLLMSDIYLYSYTTSTSYVCKTPRLRTWIFPS